MKCLVAALVTFAVCAPLVFVATALWYQRQGPEIIDDDEGRGYVYKSPSSIVEKFSGPMNMPPGGHVEGSWRMSAMPQSSPQIAAAYYYKSKSFQNRPDEYNIKIVHRATDPDQDFTYIAYTGETDGHPHRVRIEFSKGGTKRYIYFDLDNDGRLDVYADIATNNKTYILFDNTWTEVFWRGELWLSARCYARIDGEWCGLKFEAGNWQRVDDKTLEGWKALDDLHDVSEDKTEDMSVEDLR